MSQEQEQEKLMQAASQGLNNYLQGTTRLINSLYKPKIRIEVKTAKDDLKNATNKIKHGISPKRIAQQLKDSPVVKGMSDQKKLSYVNAILKKAQITDKISKMKNLEKSQDQSKERSQESNRDTQRER